MASESPKFCLVRAVEASLDKHDRFLIGMHSRVVFIDHPVASIKLTIQLRRLSKRNDLKTTHITGQIILESCNIQHGMSCLC
jgi:hypothetical protein